MKNIILFLSFIISSASINILNAQVGINSDNSDPDASAMLDVKSTTQGVLIPRMTSSQRTLISSPATGLLVFDTTTGGFWFFNGTAWENLSAGGSAPTEISDADGDTKVQVEESADEDILRFDIGGTEVLTISKNNNGFTLFENLNSQNSSTYFGQNAGESTTTGSYNSIFGKLGGRNLSTGDFNTLVGYNAGRNLNSGSKNTIIGLSAGHTNNGSGNVFIGYNAGYSETGSNKLYIDNTTTTSPLVYGEFNNNLLRINGNLQIKNAYLFPNTDGTDGQVLTTDGAGNASWQDLPNNIVTYENYGTLNYTDNDSWHDVTNAISLDLETGDQVVFQGQIAAALDLGSGEDPFEIRVKVGGCSTDLSTTRMHYPDNESPHHNYTKQIPYLDFWGVPCTGTLNFTLQVRNTGDDSYQINNRAFMVSKY